MVSEVKQRAPEAAYLMRLVRPPRIHRGVVEVDEVLMSLLSARPRFLTRRRDPYVITFFHPIDFESVRLTTADLASQPMETSVGPLIYMHRIHRFMQMLR